MTRTTIPNPHELHIRCTCAEFGVPMIPVAIRAETRFRNASADYRCPNCGRGRRAIKVSHPLFGVRLRFQRI